jgi:phosphatidylglycerophosphate synthase
LLPISNVVERILKEKKMAEKKFTGDKKAPMQSLLTGVERKFIDGNVAKFPAWIEGYHLTLLSIPWTIGLVVFGYLSKNNLNWLWGSSAMLFLQWYTDSFDGALGRFRDTGIPKWGFFMDHFLDFVFMVAIFFGYAFILEDTNRVLMYFMGLVYGALMVNSFLSFAITGEFKITYLRTGPTEVRLFFILLNVALSVFGTVFLEKSLLYIFVVYLAVTCFVVWRTQKFIWSLDMADIAARDSEN